MPIIAILLLFFLFYGEPDVWDRLHHWAMTVGTEPRPNIFDRECR